MSYLMSGDDKPLETFHDPVRLSSIEQFHLFDSSEQFPNAITGKFLFRGALDENLARQAWAIMLRRQRIGMWPIKRNWRGMAFFPDQATEESAKEIVDSTFHWQRVDDWPESELDLQVEQTNAGGIPHLDMQTAGYGIWCLVGKEKVTLVLSVHHAYTDGPGGVIIIRDWMTIYHNLVNGREPMKGLGKLDFRKWRMRNKLGLFSWDYLKTLPLQPIAVFGAAKFVLRKFCFFGNRCGKEGAAVSTTNEKTKYGFPGIAGAWIDKGAVDELEKKSDQYGVRLNSLLMIKLIRAVGKWKATLESSGRSAENESFKSKWVRVILPISIRRLADRHLPAANKATIVQIDRTVGETEDEPQATKMLDREIKIIVGFNLDRIFLILIRMLSVSPWLLERLAKSQKPRGTVIFTNLGAPLRKTRACDFQTIGELELIDFDLCGPIRSGTPINVAFQRHHDKARVTLHYDRRVFSSETVNEFLHSLIAEYRND